MQAWFSIRFGVGSEESKQASLSAHLIAALNFELLKQRVPSEACLRMAESRQESSGAQP